MGTIGQEGSNPPGEIEAKMNLRPILAVVGEVLNGSRKATKYVSPTLVIKASRRHRPRRGERTTEIVLTVGKPNFAERSFIAEVRRAGEPFPVRKVQLKGWK